MSKDNAELLGALDKLTAVMLNEFRGLKHDLSAQGERIARMEGRLDEQSRMLAALIPVTVAAVPAAPQSARQPLQPVRTADLRTTEPTFVAGKTKRSSAAAEPKRPSAAAEAKSDSASG